MAPGALRALSACCPVASPALLGQLTQGYVRRQHPDFLQLCLQRLPFPLDDQDQQAGCAPRLSIWQMEFSLTPPHSHPMGEGRGEGVMLLWQPSQNSVDSKIVFGQEAVHELVPRLIGKRTTGR